jgi:hypothetical protein
LKQLDELLAEKKLSNGRIGRQALNLYDQMGKIAPLQQKLQEMVGGSTTQPASEAPPAN